MEDFQTVSSVSFWLFVGAVAIVGAVSPPASVHAAATITLTVTNTTLQPNTASNLIGIYVSDSAQEAVTGMTLTIQIGDGGPLGNLNDAVTVGRRKTAAF